MSTASFDLTDAELRQLMTELPDGPHTAGRCPITDDVIDYLAETLSTDALQTVDTHLSACPVCCARVQQLVDAAEPWLSPTTAAERLQQLRASLKRAWADARESDVALTRVGPVPIVVASASRRSRQASRLVLPLGAAAMIGFVVSAALFVQNRRLQESRRAAHQAASARTDRQRAGDAATRPETSQERGNQQSASTVVVSTILVPGLSRAAGSVERPLALSHHVAELELTLLLDRDEYRNYAATMETVTGSVIARLNKLESDEVWTDQRGIVIHVAAQSFRTDDYVIRLHGTGTDGRLETVADYSLRVVRPAY